jgi:predicted membrane protein
MLLTILLILIIFSIIGVVLTLLDCKNLELSITREGFLYFIRLFEPFNSLLTATFIAIPVYIGLETFLSSINNQEGKALIDLRKLLNEPENLEIHKKLRGTSGEWAMGIPEEQKNDLDTWRKIDNYLGILELINILIDKDVISKDNFNSQFGYRIDNIQSNQDIKDYLEEYPDHQTVWKELYGLFSKRPLE